MRKNNNGNASTKFCSNCGIPLPQYPLMGRPWNGAPPAYYCCYGCLAVGEEHKEKQQITENTDTSQFISRLSLSGWKLGISILIVSQIMIFGIAVNLHRDISSQTKLFVKIIIMIGAIIVSIVLGSNLLKTVYINLVQRRISIELLFLITLLGSFIASCDSLVNDYEYTYFEVIPILLITYTLGNIIVAKARERAIQKAASWSEEICIARKVTTNQEYCLVPVDKIEIGDYIQVRPGELVPVNGVITQGTAYVFSHLLTGNQHPMIRRINDIIYAGEIVYDSVLYIRVVESDKDRWINSIINTAKKTQTDIQLEPSYVNWITKIFVKILIIVSLVTFLYWYVLQEVPWHRALYYSSSVLLVSCPCVFGIAIPLITWRTIRLLADNGLIVRKHDFIRKIPEITCIVFDKTGTLTHIDKYDIEIITPLHGQERNILLSQLSFIEQHTNHPVAVALRDLYNHTAEHNRCILHKLTIVPACGITAEIEQDGTRFTYDIGTSDWILKICDTSLFKQVWNINENSNIHGSILISRNKVLLCIMNLRERWHDNIDNILEKLINMRVKIYILTGEKDSYIYNSKNVVLCTNMSPAQKEQFVQMKIEQKEKVLYIGDGINDVPAMCCSYVSIGIASRSDLVASLTDAILYNRDLGIIPWVIDICSRARVALAKSLTFALIYNLLGISMAAMGILDPVSASLLMTFSGLTLITYMERIYEQSKCHYRRDLNKMYSMNRNILTIIVVVSITIYGTIILHIYRYDFLLILYIIIITLISYLLYFWNIDYMIMFSSMMISASLSHVFNLSSNIQSSYAQICYPLNSLSEFGAIVSMLILSNVFSILFCWKQTTNIHKFSMLIGGNLGMLLGFGILHTNVNSVYPPIYYNHLIMDVVMFLGMLVGTVIMENIAYLSIKFHHIFSYNSYYTMK